MNFDTLSNAFSSALAAMTWVEGIAVIFGLVYLLLAARESLWCWPAAIISVGLYLYICIDIKYYSDAGLQVYYLAMAVYGWYAWKNGASAEKETLPIRTLPYTYHLYILAGGTAASLALGWAMSSYTDAALPYMDAFTTVFSLVTTVMVTRKVLENWLYWLVIDSVAIYMYFQKELYLTSLLFLIYVIIVVFGYFDWQKKYQTATA